MAKSTKKASTKVDAPAVVATPTKTLKKGKREAEEPIEKVVVSSKKQKVEEKKIEAKKEAPEKKVETSSDEDSFSSEYNEVTAKKAPAASGAAPKKESSSDEDAPAAKKASAAPSKPVPASANKKAECSSDESSDEEEMSSDGDVPVAEKLAESSSDESSDEEEMSSDGDVPVAEKTSVAPSKLDPLASAAKKKADSSSDESSNEETSSDVDVPATKKAFAAPLIPVAPASKEESCSDDESSDEDATPKSLQKPFTKKKDESEESESDEESSDDEPKTPSTPKELPGGSKTLFVGNLSFSVEQADVENFFKSAGEIVDIRFATGQDNSLKGFGHVEFATSEAAQKALQELNGHDLVGRPVRLEVARVRGAATLYSVGRDSKSSQNGRAQGQTVSVCGFSTYDGEELQVPKTSLKRATGDAKQAKKSKKAQPDDDSEQSFEESEEDEPQKKKIKSQKSSSLEESSEEEDSSKEEEEHSKTPKKNPKTPSTPMEQQGDSKTLFVGNLSFSVEQADVENFFKSAGEIVDIRFATGQDNSLKGFGHVEFATSEAAQKALQELNGHDLLGRPVRLELARERGAVTPYSGGRDSQSFQNGRAQGQTVFVRGFSTYDSEEQIRSALEDHFGSCGEITRISIPKKDQDGGIKGIAYVEFKEADSLGEALKLSGSQLGESTLYVDEAKPKGDSAGGGRGGGRGFGISGSQDTGGKFGGRRGGGRDGGARGRFGGGGKVRGGFNKPNLATAGNGFYSSFSISPEIIANTWKI